MTFAWVKQESHDHYTNYSVSYSTAVLYKHEELGFSSQKYHPKPVSIIPLHDSLAALVKPKNVLQSFYGILIFLFNRILC